MSLILLTVETGRRETPGEVNNSFNSIESQKAGSLLYNSPSLKLYIVNLPGYTTVGLQI